MRAATLFSGIGVPELAMPEWEWLWHADFAPFPSAVMQAHHPGSINLGDVIADDFTDRAARYGRPDVVVFGSPCQSFSVAGRRLGLDDPRGNLALAALRVIGILRPTWFVFENVPGLLSIGDGRDFGFFLRAVDELGYHVGWAVLDAQHFGVAQRRSRLFVVGHARDWRYPAAVLLECESLCGRDSPRSAARQRAAADAQDGAARGGDDEMMPEVTGTIEARENGGGGGWSSDFMMAGGAVVPPIRTGDNRTGGYRKPGTDVDSAESLVIAFADLADPIAANQQRTYTREGTHNFRLSNVVAFHENQRAEVTAHEVVTTLSADGGKPGQGYPAVLTPNTEADRYDTNRVSPQETRSVEALRVLFAKVDEEALVRWNLGILAPFWPSEVLRSDVHGGRLRREGLSFRGLVYLALSRQETDPGWAMRTLWEAACVGCPPPGWELPEQQARELTAHLSLLPQSPSPAEAFLRLVWQASEGARLLRQALSAVQKVRRSACVQAQPTHRRGVRRLTVEECEALQGLPRGYSSIMFRGKPAKDGPRYKAIGNAMCLPVMRWILERLDVVHRLERGARRQSA